VERIGQVALAHPVTLREQAQADELAVVRVRIAQPALDGLAVQVEDPAQRPKGLHGGLISVNGRQQFGPRAVGI
jgi:hypothetical protein